MININNLSSIVTLLAAPSIASERLVEIIKGFSPFLSRETPDWPRNERHRKAILQVPAVAAALLTAWLAKDTGAIQALIPDSNLAWISLGLLASGGSGFGTLSQPAFPKLKTSRKQKPRIKRSKESP